MDSKTTIIEVEHYFGNEDPKKVLGELVAKKIKAIKAKKDEIEKADSYKLPFVSE